MLLNALTSESNLPSTKTKMTLLVLCTGNSARSIMAEALFNSLGAQWFKAYSAGSKPTGRVNPLAIEQVQVLNLSPEYQFSSQSWHHYTRPNAPAIDLVLTVCSNAENEQCPVFLGNYKRVHWGFADPAGSSPDLEIERQAFARCFAAIHSRVQALVSQLNSSSTTDEVYQIMKAIENEGKH